MSEFESAGLRILIVRPGQTELDEQGRIAGNLDIPLSNEGRDQIAALACEFANLEIDKIYSGPTAASKETAEMIAAAKKTKVKIDDDLQNLDCGLWHGKRIEELKETQPKLFKLWQEQPQSVYPPDGESVEQTKNRVEKFARKITKKARTATIVVVASEPVACILRSVLESVEISTYWTVDANCGTWFEVIKDFQAVSG